jgi:hypothetical protein
MKRNRKHSGEVGRVQEIAEGDSRSGTAPSTPASMVRTQIYLSARQQEFLQREANREGETMAGIIRRFIDEKMTVPDEAWANNPLLEPTPNDPANDLPEDASINLDHYAYGAPKHYKKSRGKWVAMRPGK